MEQLRTAHQRLGDAEYAAVQRAFLAATVLRIRASAGLGCGVCSIAQYEEARAQLASDLRKSGAPPVRARARPKAWQVLP